MEGKDVFAGVVFGALVASSWWSLAMFGVRPYTLASVIVITLIAIVSFIVWIID